MNTHTQPRPSRPAAPPPGRPVVLEPTPPGFWALILGGCVAALAPLLGFLGGSMTGSPAGNTGWDPLFLWLFAGSAIGAIGIVIAAFGGRRLWRHHHPRQDSSGAAGAGP